jgi:RNA polymerase sigma-70 factor (ECF subfamily)
VSDDELILGLRHRDPAALTALMDAYLTPVYALCTRILAGAGSSQDAEECASDAFHLAWQQIERYDPTRAPLRTWLLMLTKYTALDRRRRLQKSAIRLIALPRAESHASAAQYPDEDMADAEARERLQAALDSLAPLERELIYRHHFLGETTKALADALTLTPQAVDNRLWRARRQLKAFLSANDEDLEEVRRR